MEIVRDTVCGELIAWKSANGVLPYHGKLYYFCCRKCYEKFRRSPTRFAGKK